MNITDSDANPIVINTLKKYPYNCSKQEDDIKSNSKSMLNKIIKESNTKLEEYGINVDSVQITEAVYSPDIAHSMLMKQQAMEQQQMMQQQQQQQQQMMQQQQQQQQPQQMMPQQPQQIVQQPQIVDGSIDTFKKYAVGKECIF